MYFSDVFRKLGIERVHELGLPTPAGHLHGDDPGSSAHRPLPMATAPWGRNRSLWEGSPVTGTVNIEQANGAGIGRGGFLEVAGWEPLTRSDRLIMGLHPCGRK